jgi:hypothetical protein
MMENSRIAPGLLLLIFAFSRLTVGQQAPLIADQLISLSAAQLSALSGDQLINLGAQQRSRLSAQQLNGLDAAPLTCYDGWVMGDGEVDLGNFTKTTCTEHQVYNLKCFISSLWITNYAKQFCQNVVLVN